MEIYLLKNNFTAHRNIMPVEQEEQRYLADNYGQSMQKEWNPIDFVWNHEDGEEPWDMFLYMGYILIANKKCISVLKDIISKGQCEILPIYIEKEEYYVINTCSIYNGIIDLKKSKVEYFKDNSIKWIDDFVFYTDCCNSPIFHVKEFQSALFVSEHFLSCSKEFMLSGLKFIKCKESKPFFLKSLFK